MDNIITINNFKDNTIEFDIETQGFDTSVDMSVRMVVSATPVTFSFRCEKENKKWVCKIPAMSYLTPSAYPFVIEVVIDGYFFESLHGTLNVVATKDVYAHIPQSAKTITSSQATEEEEETLKRAKPIKVKQLDITSKPTAVKDDKQEAPKNTKDTEVLAKKIMADVKKNGEEPEEKESQKKQVSEEEKRAKIIREILDSVIIGKKMKSRFSIRDQFPTQ